MRRVVVPIAVYGMLAAIYGASSGAPDTMHALPLALLALAFLVPAIWAAQMQSLRSRTLVSASCALLAMLSWDLTAHLVIAKAEPLGILLGAPLAYALGLVALTLVNLVAAHLGAPPNNSSKPTPLRGAA